MGCLNRERDPRGQHFPHAAARRTSFDVLAQDYTKTVLTEFDELQRAARGRQLEWWSKQFTGLRFAEITAANFSVKRQTRDRIHFTR